MQAHALGVIGLDARTFWGLTMPEYAAVADRALGRRREENDLANRRTARVMAMLYNTHVAKGRRKTEDDYMPRRMERMTPEQMYRAVKEHHALMA